MSGQAELSRVLARRSTFDDKTVCLWSDGSLTTWAGHAIKGAWFNPKPGQQERALRAGWLALGEVSLFTAQELPALARAARRVAERCGLPGEVRALASKLVEKSR